MKRSMLFLLLIVPIIAGYIWVQPHSSNRFRLTVEVDTPEGLKSGSSVIETVRWESGGLPEATGVRSKAKGEAIFVDLGHRQNLIAILGWGRAGENEDEIFDLTRAALAPRSTIDWETEYRLKGRGDLPPGYFPTLITFGDLNNPATAKVVNPADLEKSFGVGYSLRRIVLETTTDSITHTITSKLPWWSSPGRPAEIAWRAWLSGQNVGVSQEPERLFIKS